jgi:hypothetical protein
LELFEFILIITSVVYALALAQILTGIARLAQTEATNELYFPHTVWTAILFIAILLTWWAGWEFRGVEWTFPKYVYLFVSPILIFFAASLMIPQRIAESGVNLEKHFKKVQRPVLWSYFTVLVIQFVDGSLLATEPWWFPGRLPQLAVLGAVAGCALTKSRRLQSAFSIGVLVFLIYVVIVRFWIPE